jgi:crossover junction endodeoxyribonuclease RuvC
MNPASRTRAPRDLGFRILGIDPGTLRLGYGVVECITPAVVRYVECGTITAPARWSRADRLVEIGRGLRELVDELRPDAVAMEDAFFGKNVQSTLALGEARGVALLIAGEAGLTIVGYPPAAVKKAVVGHGRASKDQIAYLVRATLSLRRTPPADAADALAIAICHARGSWQTAGGRVQTAGGRAQTAGGRVQTAGGRTIDGRRPHD